MKTLTLPAYAKLNLSLDILSRRPDGYHMMLMVMQSVSLCDEVTVSEAKDITVTTNLRFLPNDERNIAFKAAKAFFDASGITGGAEIAIKKRIPVGTGMGGGSADAGAVLRALNEIYGRPFSMTELASVGEAAGSDVPFCVLCGTCLAEGKGELLTPIAPLPDCHIVIAKPPFSISTPVLFSRIRVEKIRCRPDTAGLVSALESGDLKNIGHRMYNVFEDVLPRNAAQISSIKQTLLDYGALGAVMTGTGSAVFGLYRDEASAEGAYRALREQYEETYIARPVGKCE